MSVRVRLTRVGSKKNPIWRVVVADGRSPRDGRFIEAIGHYNPQTQPSTIRIDEERFQHWVARGAQPTGTVKKLMQAQARSGPSELDGAGATATAVAEPAAPAAEGEQPAADTSQAPAGGDQLASEGEQPAADAGTATGPEGGPAAAEGAVREEPAEQDGGGVAGAEAPGAAGDAEEPELPPAEDQPSPEA